MLHFDFTKSFEQMALSLPARYRAAGFFLALTGLLCLWVAYSEGLINFYRIILPGNTLPDGSYPYPSNFWDINAVFEKCSLCSLAIGVATAFLAKEPDEYFYQIRLESIRFAVSAQFLVGQIAFGYFYFTPGYRMENTFQDILGLACGSFLVAYVLRYYSMIYFKQEKD